MKVMGKWCLSAVVRGRMGRVYFSFFGFQKLCIICNVGFRSSAASCIEPTPNITALMAVNVCKFQQDQMYATDWSYSYSVFDVHNDSRHFSIPTINAHFFSKLIAF